MNARTNPQTRCSNCQTVFEVARELLSSSDTRVRCGECLSIFDALEQLRSAEQMADEKQATSTIAVSGLVKTPSPAEPAAVQNNETAALDVTYSDFDIFSEEANLPEIAYFDQTRDTPDFDFDAVEMGNDETFNDYLFAHDVTIDANSLNNKPLGNQAQPNSEYADVDFVTSEQAQEPLIFNYKDREQPPLAPAPAPAPATTANTVPTAHGAQARTIDSPAVKLNVGRQAKALKGRSERSPWFFRLTMLLLLGVLLGALFAYRTRPQLHNNPSLRPMLEAACKIMRCTLPARTDIASLKMVKRNVYSHPKTPNALVINVSFRNEANFAQQLPVLQMVLSNRVGRIVARQDFNPNAYMPDWEEGAVIEANQQLDVKLEVTDPGQDAQNFEFHFR